MDNDTETLTPTVMRPSALEAQTRAEFDIQIATAHRFPRSVSGFLKNAESMATATVDIAKSMQYAKPVGGGKVTGESVRLAEIVAATYGNLRVSARVIAETDTEVVAQGVAHDLESNVAQSTEVAVSILTKDGRRYGPDQVATVRAAACAKARRNATFLVVPKALCLPIINAARRVAGGDAKTLPERRDAQLAWFEKQGIKRATIFAWLGVKAEDDIGLEEMADLIAASNTSKEEGCPLASIFAVPREGSERFKEDLGKAPPKDPPKDGPKPVTLDELTEMVQRATAATTPEQVLSCLLEVAGKKTAAEVPEAKRGDCIRALRDLAGL